MQLPKKITAILACAMVSLSAFSGCQNAPSQPASSVPDASLPAGETNSAPAQAQPYTLPLTDTPVTLSYMSCESWTPEYSLADNREIWQEIEKRTGVSLEWQVVPDGDYDTVLKTKIAGGDIPDITGVKGSTNVIQLYNDGLTIDHGEYISRYAPNIQKIIDEVPDARAQMVGPDGKTYAAAVCVREKTANVKGIYYRRDWQKKLGIADPVTREDYYAMFKAFTDNDPNGNGQKDEVALYTKSIGDLGPIATSFGLNFQVNTSSADVGFAVEQGEVTYEFLKPEFKDFLAYMKSYYDAGIVPKEVFGTAQVEKTLLSNNRMGAYYNGLGQCDTYDKVLLQSKHIDSINMDTGYYWMTPVATEAGERISPAFLFVEQNLFVISAKCKDPELAIKWMDYVWATEEGKRFTTLGIEGKSYNMVDGKPVLTDYLLNNPDGIGVHPALRTLGAFTPWIAYWEDEAFAAQWVNNEKLSKVISDAKPTMKLDTLPKILGTPEEAATVASRMVDVTTYRDEMILKFIMGQESLDKFDTYVENLKGMGIEEVIAIKQAQYNALIGK